MLHLLNHHHHPTGKAWVPKPNEGNGNDEKILLDLEDGSEGALEGATEADLVDLAGILGLHSMLSQDQYHASILNKGQLPSDKFESVVKATVPKKLPPMEPDNVTDPEKTAKMVMENDPSLTELNWNNIKYIPRETFKKLFTGLKSNTNLKSLHLSNTGLTDGPAEVSVFVVWCAHTISFLVFLMVIVLRKWLQKVHTKRGHARRNVFSSVFDSTFLRHFCFGDVP